MRRALITYDREPRVPLFPVLVGALWLACIACALVQAAYRAGRDAARAECAERACR